MGGDSIMAYEDKNVGFRYPDKFIGCTEPVGETKVGPGTEYPFKMTLEHAMYLYWKIYSFNISGAYTFKWRYFMYEGKVNTVTTVALIGETIDPEFKNTGGWPQKMSQMVCANANPVFYGYKIVGSSAVNSSFGGSFALEVFGELSILRFKPILRTEEKDDFKAKYYIPFVCNLGLGNDYGGGVTTFPDPTTFGARVTVPGLFKLKIDDTTYYTSLTGLEVLRGGFGLSLQGTVEMKEEDARLAK
jgi:hypothetical protein